MGDGTEQNPYTREDVLRRIRRHGGTAKGLDLSGKVFKEGIDLSKLDLEGIILRKAQFFDYRWVTFMLKVYVEEDFLGDVHPEEAPRLAHFEGARLLNAHLEGAELSFARLEGADLGHAHLEEANLFHANLEGAFLGDTHFEGACLSGAHFERAVLVSAHLEGASLGGAKFTADTKLENADWGNYILGEEKNGAFPLAAETYRRLKMWHTNAGIYDIAGEFSYREREARRKSFKLLSKNWFHRVAFQFSYWLFGHGERWRRILCWMAVAVFGSAAAYCLSGELSFLYSLYFSVVSFTALGYGKWVDITPPGWVQALGAAESIIGVFMMALLLVTFVRKWTR